MSVLLLDEERYKKWVVRNDRLQAEVPVRAAH